MNISVRFLAVMIKMSNFSTCSITSMPLKMYHDKYKSISLTDMKTQGHFIPWYFFKAIRHIELAFIRRCCRSGICCCY